MEQFQQFADEQIRPYTREVGFESEPEIQTYPVHNYLTAG